MANTVNLVLIQRLGAALAIGLLIGLERGWEHREFREGQRAAGFRTFGMIGLLGGVAAQIGGTMQGLVLAAIGAAVSLFVALGYWREPSRETDISITGLVAAVLTFCLGALAGIGELVAASSCAVIVALLLGFKPELHGFIRRIDRRELLATLRLLLISVVLLPVLPNTGIGPWQALNPYQTWWMVVLVAGISYLGYIAIRVLGQKRGVLMTALCGGMVSSTAVTVNLARQARARGADPNLLAAGVATATTMMFPRMLVVIGVVSLPLAGALAWPLSAAALLTAIAASWFLSRRPTVFRSDDGNQPGNPLDLRTALQFGLFLAVTMILTAGAKQMLGDHALYVLAAMAGLVDVDAISLSCASMVIQHKLSIAAAAHAVLLAAASNTILKPFIVMKLGDLRTALRVIATTAAAVVAGGIVIWLMPR